MPGQKKRPKKPSRIIPRPLIFGTKKEPNTVQKRTQKTKEKREGEKTDIGSISVHFGTALLKRCDSGGGSCSSPPLTRERRKAQKTVHCRIFKPKSHLGDLPGKDLDFFWRRPARHISAKTGRPAGEPQRHIREKSGHPAGEPYRHLGQSQGQSQSQS